MAQRLEAFIYVHDTRDLPLFDAEALQPTLEHRERKLLERDGLERVDGRIVRKPGGGG